MGAFPPTIEYIGLSENHLVRAPENDGHAGLCPVGSLKQALSVASKYTIVDLSDNDLETGPFASGLSEFSKVRRNLPMKLEVLNILFLK